VGRYQAKYGRAPLNYALTAYDAVMVIDDTIGRLVRDGMPITRQNVRDYAAQTSLPTLQGVIAFDENGDLKDKIVSVFQVKDGAYQFVGAAPQT
jgi:branched-chain amino acid transport system substrate-binding protein